MKGFTSTSNLAKELGIPYKYTPIMRATLLDEHVPYKQTSRGHLWKRAVALPVLQFFSPTRKIIVPHKQAQQEREKEKTETVNLVVTKKRSLGLCLAEYQAAYEEALSTARELQAQLTRLQQAVNDINEIVG